MFLAVLCAREIFYTLPCMICLFESNVSKHCYMYYPNDVVTDDARLLHADHLDQDSNAVITKRD